jgi:hypothetical protein
MLPVNPVIVISRKIRRQICAIIYSSYFIGAFYSQIHLVEKDFYPLRESEPTEREREREEEKGKERKEKLTHG